MPVAGEVIDDVFRVEAEIDSGNFGSVYRVHDMLEDRTLALKVLRPGPHDEGELRQRFEREARLIYSLQHRHIVQVYYYGETNSGLPYMAMEYLEGTDLRTLLYHHGALNHALVKRITLETLSALDAAHELGIIHRDLKPANIFLAKDGGKGHVKVLDFGFAKALDDSSPLSEITNAGTLVGTPAYMAPELVHKKRVGPAADIYAMGLIMAEMLKGDKIIEIDAVYDTILFQASPENIRFGPYVTDSPFAEVVRKATQKSLDSRYRSAKEMGADLGGLPQYDVEPPQSASGPVHRKLYITDQLTDSDVTIPRALGLPSEEELARLMGRPSGDVGIDSQERTVELASVRDKIEQIPEPRRPESNVHMTVRQTPAAGHQTPRPRNEEQGGGATRGSDRRAAGPQPGRVPSQRPPRQSPVGLDREIEDLGRGSRPRPRPERQRTGMNEIFWGLVLGILLLGILVAFFWMTKGNPIQ